MGQERARKIAKKVRKYYIWILIPLLLIPYFYVVILSIAHPNEAAIPLLISLTAGYAYSIGLGIYYRNKSYRDKKLPSAWWLGKRTIPVMIGIGLIFLTFVGAPLWMLVASIPTLLFLGVLMFATFDFTERLGKRLGLRD